ncbi:MAG: hypothetical protein V4552_00450 [Pseudomonadota bacterium]
MDKALLVKKLIEWSANDSKGYFVTLNARTNDKIQFEQDLSKFAHKLNDYCYGRAYKRKEKRLKFMAGIEIGQLNEMLHAHLFIQHDDQMSRTFDEVSSHIRNQWYGLIGLNNTKGSMVDVSPIGNVPTRLSYIVKDTAYLKRNDFFNLIWL